jgi:hypothetical protein
MTTARAGRNAAIYIDCSSGGTAAATPISMKNKWTLDQSTDKYETTAFGDANKSYVTGVPDAKGTFAGMWDSDDVTYYNLIGSSIPRKLYLYPDRLNVAGAYFFTTAYFDISHDTGTAQVVNLNGNWSAGGAAAWVHA